MTHEQPKNYVGNRRIFRKDEKRKSRKERYEREMSRKEIGKEPS